MSLERWELTQRQKGNNAGASLAKWMRIRWGDEPIPEEATPQLVPTRTDSRSEADSSVLESAVEAYKKEPHNPEVITAVWRAFLPEAADAIPPLHWSSEEIAAPFIGITGDDQDTIMVPVPEVYRGREGLVQLALRFREMGIYYFFRNFYINSEARSQVWTKIEASIPVPNQTVSHEVLSKHFELEGRLGQRAETYILGSQFTKAVKGVYFDPTSQSTSTESILLGTWVNSFAGKSGPLTVRFHNDRLQPNVSEPKFRLETISYRQGLGGRSEEIK